MQAVCFSTILTRSTCEHLAFLCRVEFVALVETTTAPPPSPPVYSHRQRLPASRAARSLIATVTYSTTFVVSRPNRHTCSMKTRLHRHNHSGLHITPCCPHEVALHCCASLSQNRSLYSFVLYPIPCRTSPPVRSQVVPTPTLLLPFSLLVKIFYHP